MLICDNLFIKVRKNETFYARYYLNILKVNSFYEAITKKCWELGIQYEVLIKNKYNLEILLMGNSKSILVKFHKAFTVNSIEYQKFIETVESYKISKAIYITTGDFDDTLLYAYHKGVYLEDGVRFIKYQIGWFKKASEAFKTDNLKVYRYMPV
ncbi:hypothetical protein IAI10_01840 [Clostridium sp. 19966]|uniref:hypothetical protein n=1 Tax=Clostridium sp. 19966 TaxID=2768166 RepID=UPI0028DEDA49|nr:hypothetical protein [Clostridium sp. 19966]MDT8715397.1 hypothetical protein [Clostridium sp. 19966]